MVLPVLVAAERRREHERCCEPRWQTEEEADPVDQSGRSFLRARGSMLPAPRKRYATAASERRTIPAIAGLERASRSAEDERKRADAGGTREEGDVHQPSEIAQRILAGRVAVVEFWFEDVEECDQSDAKERPGNGQASPPDEPVGPARSTNHSSECIHHWGCGRLANRPYCCRLIGNRRGSHADQEERDTALGQAVDC